MTAPVLLTHGDRDTNVPVLESVQAHQELTALGAPAELLLLKGEGHTIVGRENLLAPVRAGGRVVRSVAVSEAPRVPSPVPRVAG